MKSEKGGHGVVLDIETQDGFVVQSQSTARPPAENWSDREGEEDEDRKELEFQLRQFAQKEVHPEMGLRIVKGRMLLSDSGILDELIQMRQARQPLPSRQAQRPSTTTAQNQSTVTRGRPSSAAAHCLPAGAVTRVPSHVARKRMISPLYNPIWEGTNVRDTRFTSESLQSLTRPLPHRMPSKRAPHAYVRTSSTDSQLDESVYTGHAFAGYGQDIRPASAPPGKVQLDMDALQSFNEAVARGEMRADLTFEIGPLEEENVSSDDAEIHHEATGQSMPAPLGEGGISSLDFLTAPEWQHIPIDQLMPTLFGNDVVQRPHRDLLELASKKMIEGKHVKSMKGAMRKLTQDWTARRGQWNTRSWSSFGADSRVSQTRKYIYFMFLSSRVSWDLQPRTLFHHQPANN